MTPSRPKRKWLLAAIGPCVIGLLMVPIAQRPAVASPTGIPQRSAAFGSVNLRLNQSAATRVMAELSGAAQESDTEKPKPMDDQATEAATRASKQAAAAKKAPPPEDKLAMLKDWPFWVIVGGVVIAGVGGYMLLHNSNQKAPCAPQFTAGCFPP